jgi:hypothetical protein
MEGSNQAYQIVLEKGEAARRYFELSEDEKLQIGLRILSRVTSLAEQVGAKPVIANSSRPKRPRIKRSIY